MNKKINIMMKKDYLKIEKTHTQIEFCLFDYFLNTEPTTIFLHTNFFKHRDELQQQFLELSCKEDRNNQ